MMNSFLCNECGCHVDSEKHSDQVICDKCAKDEKFEKYFWPIAFIPVLVLVYISMISSGGM